VKINEEISCTQHIDYVSCGRYEKQTPTNNDIGCASLLARSSESKPRPTEGLDHQNNERNRTTMKLIPLLLLIPTIASASIGSTESECVAKYGTNLGGVNPDYKVYSSVKSGIKINALLLNGRVVRIVYTANMTPKRRSGLMKMNGSGWTKFNVNQWRSRNGVEAKLNPSFIIITNNGYTPPRKQTPIRVEVRRRPITRSMVGGG